MYNDNATHSNGSIPLTVNFPSLLQMTNEQFYEFCQARELRIERTLMGSCHHATSLLGYRKSQLQHCQLGNWADIEDGTGICFDSSTGFTLPNGATRSPDASWIKWSAGMP